jgi:sugar lactone lactonase YvrE
VNRHHVLSLRTIGLLAAPLLALPLVGGPAHADYDHGRPDTYQLTGDRDGSKFEGIGADHRRGVFYVSEVTGGEIHRGSARSAQTAEWLPEGADGRLTARGITVDRSGRVYIAGGPNGLGTGRPDLWVYSPAGELLAALRAPGHDAFLNDVTIGADGAAYFTNSNDPQIFRVADDGEGWTASLWADAHGTIERQPGFNLGGIVLTADRSALVVAQGTTGQLWRFDSADRSVSPVDSTGADLVNADGLVRQGNTLTVVRNFSRMLATLHVSADGRIATLSAEQATDPTRVLTTAATLRGRTLFVDSKFDEPVANPPYEVVTDPTAP